MVAEFSQSLKRGIKKTEGEERADEISTIADNSSGPAHHGRRGAGSPVKHLSSHETVVYGGEIAGQSVFRFVNRCDSFYLSLFCGGSNQSYMIAFKKDERGVYGIGYEFNNLEFATTLASGDPDPEMATNLLSRSRILRFAGSRHKSESKR